MRFSAWERVAQSDAQTRRYFCVQYANRTAPSRIWKWNNYSTSCAAFYNERACVQHACIVLKQVAAGGFGSQRQQRDSRVTLSRVYQYAHSYFELRAIECVSYIYFSNYTRTRTFLLKHAYALATTRVLLSA